MTREKYYAIRIGDPRRHSPYFMLDANRNNVPRLFLTRSEAAREMERDPSGASWRIVKVWIHDGNCKES